MYKGLTSILLLQIAGSLADKGCNTVRNGPNQYQRCSFPFIWKGIKHRSCAHSSTPSAVDKDCKALKADNPDVFKMLGNKKMKYNDDEKVRVILKDERGKIITSCFSDHPGLYGW